jgi:NAD(P)-dependent dehydrogenase (short-subunit alcohol dehydrogenase family)
MSDIAGKKVVITGAGRGIGREMSLRACADGAIVALIEIDSDTLTKTLSDILESGGKAYGYQLDLGDEHAVKATFEKIAQDMGEIDALVNNAIVNEAEALHETSLESWNNSLKITLTGAFLCVKEVLPMFMARKRGNIINIGTANAKGMFGSDAYSVAKAGVHQMTRSIAVRYGEYGVRCNTVVPGTIATEAWIERAKMNPQVFEDLKPWYPLGRVGSPKDVAEMVLFIISDRSEWITGAELIVDGGLLAGYAPMLNIIEGRKP